MSGTSKAAASVFGLFCVVSWPMAIRMTDRCMMLVQLLGAILTLEVMAFTGNGE
jgi:hypothetical protein